MADTLTYIFLRYCPPTSNSALVICPNEQTRTASIFTGQGYGYGWFIGQASERPVRYGWGYGGQMIYVFPATGRQPAVAIAMTSDPDQPSARTGYRNDLHMLADRIIQLL